MTVELIKHAEELYKRSTHPAELHRRQLEHTRALAAIKNQYYEQCHAENQRYLLQLTKIVSEHDNKNMGSDNLPTYGTSLLSDDFVDE